MRSLPSGRPRAGPGGRQTAPRNDECEHLFRALLAADDAQVDPADQFHAPCFRFVKQFPLRVILHVDDVDASTERATGLGAKVMAPAIDVANVGRFSIVMDPTNAPVGLFKGAPTS